MKLNLWGGYLWGHTASGVIAFCAEHRTRMEVLTSSGSYPQDSRASALKPAVFVCLNDSKTFQIPKGDYRLLQRSYTAAIESLDLKDAEIVSIDGYQIPIAKAVPPEKDDTYWVEARINDTKRGKQLVIYAGKRGERDKSQMFIDPENDKITFDQNNIHPSDVFTRVVAEFESGRKTTIEGNAS